MVTNEQCSGKHKILRHPYCLARRAIKRLVIWMGLGPLLIEYCQDCGQKQPLTWHTQDKLWRDITSQSEGVLCPRCFDRQAMERLGIRIHWTAYATKG